jgi:hypothetical protein
MLGFSVSARGQSGGTDPSALKKSEWYVSNAAGMALERAWSRAAALRQPYCLLIEEQDGGLPDPIAPYYREPWIVERRVLYKNGEEFRAQWIFRDGEGVSRLVAVLNDPPAAEEVPEDPPGTAGEPAPGPAVDTGELAADDADADDNAGAEEASGKAPDGFIELYGANGLIELERELFDTGEETIVEYHYRQAPLGTREFLIRADTRRKLTDGEGNEREEDLYSDYYRYTRNYSLRAIERIFHRTAAEGSVAKASDGTAANSTAGPSDETTADSAAGAITGTDNGTAADSADEAAAESAAMPVDESGTDGGPSRVTLRFPRRSLDSKDEESFVSPAIAYGSQFLEDVQAKTPDRVVYNTDERGRIMEETRWGEDGEVIAELRNEWADNRLSRVVYTDGDDERVTEYEYNDDGDRIVERNFRNGILERVVRISGDREDEEIYMNGELVLRTQWEGGRKIREERVRSRRTGTAAPSGEAQP